MTWKHEVRRPWSTVGAALVLLLVLAVGPVSAQKTNDVERIDAGERARSVLRSELEGAEVFDSTGRHVGTIISVRATEDGHLRAARLVVGGFLGIGQSVVTLKARNLDVVRLAGHPAVVYVPMTGEQLEKLAK